MGNTSPPPTGRCRGKWALSHGQSQLTAYICSHHQWLRLLSLERFTPPRLKGEGSLLRIRGGRKQMCRKLYSWCIMGPSRLLWVNSGNFPDSDYSSLLICLIISNNRL
ncbi:unnamed protein product [Phytomonas sp. EM1]|nr:unnamed protein product [Phytomonas sp. EM1]|eukprot:CCW63525.1 unnamed protein product [Phytomonas sp. isolate EM1]